jgi:multicomponent Na+:H+ antiporter subunit B
MTRPVRIGLFLTAGACFLGLLLWGLSGLPAFGHYRGPYGNVINRVAIPQRHVTDAVAAVNFDYRGVDTVGEEFILFTATAGVALLLRMEGQEEEEQPPEDEPPEEAATLRSDAVAWLGFALIVPIVVLGLYIVSHGQLTPGGGFQGGVILATAPLLLYLAGRYRTLHKLTPVALAEMADAIGAGGFVAIGVAGMTVGVAFLQNVIPDGPVGVLYSGGTIPIINLSVGLEVAAAFLLILSEFLKQALQIHRRARQ